jgi:hypothetical protein
MKLSGRTIISAKVLWGKTLCPFHSGKWRHKVWATQGFSSSDFGKEPKFYKSVMANWTANITQTQISDILIVILYMNFLPSIYLIATLSKTRSNLTLNTLVHSIYFNSVNDRFLFKECSACLNRGYTQWVWNSSQYENLVERAKKLIHKGTMNFTHTQTDTQRQTDR